MAAATEVSVPDLGDFADVPVIEIHVAPGDVVSDEDPLITLESDKATMDIPSPAAGTVRELRVKVGDLVSRGSPILLLDTEGTLTSSRRRWPTSRSRRRQDAPEPVGRRQDRPAVAPRPRQRPGAAGDRRGGRAARRVRGCARRAGRAPAGPRARPGPDRAVRDRAEGPHHQGGRDRGVRGPGGGPGSAGRPVRRTGRHPGNPGPGLLEVRPGRDPAAVPHPAAVRARAAPVLAQRPPRHPRRRGGHHRPGRLPQGTRHRRQGRGLPGDAAGLPDEGQRLGAARIPQVQQLADAGEGRADLQGLLPPRRRRGHARGPGSAGDPRRRPQGHHGTQPGTRRRLGQGQGGQARPGRPAGRLLHDLQPWRHRRDQPSRPSSTPPRWRSSAWSGPGRHRSGTGRRSCRG